MDENLCKVCATNEGKYVCPRCNLLYCSVKCYQGRLHIRCSEEFYKENVIEHMSVNSKDSNDMNKMKDILHRLYIQDQRESDVTIDEDTLDSDDESDIAERLKSVSLDDSEAVWEKLSESEKRSFLDLVHNGCSETLVPLWKPWWTFRVPNKKIEVLGDISKTNHTDYVTECPSVRNVPPLSDITKRLPSPFVKWNIINVIASYSYMMRYFNGEPVDFISDSVNLLILISGNLRSNLNYESYDSAVDEVAYEIVQCEWLDGSETAISRMKEDIQNILHGPEQSNESFYLQAALSDASDLLSKARHNVKKGDKTPEKKKNSFSKQFSDLGASQQISSDKLKLCIKKLEYFLSWVKSCSTTKRSE